MSLVFKNTKVDESPSTLDSFTAFYETVNEVYELVQLIVVETRFSKSAHRRFDRCCSEFAEYETRVIQKARHMLSKEKRMHSDETMEIMGKAVAILDRLCASRRGVVAPTTLQQSPVS